jgi:hypothetical protein
MQAIPPAGGGCEAGAPDISPCLLGTTLLRPGRLGGSHGAVAGGGTARHGPGGRVWWWGGNIAGLRVGMSVVVAGREKDGKKVNTDTAGFGGVSWWWWGMREERDRQGWTLEASPTHA